MKTKWTTAFIAAGLVVAAVAAFGQGTQCSPTAGPGACPSAKEVKVWGSLDSKPKTNDAYQPEKVTIGIGSFDMFEIKNGAAGYTLPEREVAIYNRLTEILSKVWARPEAVCVGRVRSAPTIFVGSYRLVSVYPQDAAAAGMTQDALAAKWAAKIAEIVPKVATDNVSPKPKQAPYAVAVGGVSLFPLRCADGYASIKARGRAVEDQMVLMLSDGRLGKLAVRAVPEGPNFALKYGELQIVDVTPEDARANGTTPALLAAVWTAELNAALTKLKSTTGGTPAPQ